MENVYLNYDRAGLSDAYAKIRIEYCNATEATAIANFQAELKLIAEAFKKLNASTATSTNVHVTHTADFKAMEAWFRDSVPKFNPGSDVNVFISSLENGYKLCVTPENNLEGQFVKFAITHMCAEYSNSILKADASTRSSYAAFIKYLKANYSTQETVFQVLQHMWEIERKPDEDIHSLGVRFQEKAAETSTRITSMFEEQANINKASGADDKKMSAADVFMLVGAMQLFQHIRSREPETYKLLVREMDGVYTPADLSRKAKLYTDRLDKSDPAAQNGSYAAQAQRGGKSRRNSNEKSECFNYRDHGSCNRGDNCPYLHDPRRKKRENTDAKPREDSRPRKSFHKKKRHSNTKSDSGSNRGNDSGGAHNSQPAANTGNSNFTQVGSEVFQLP